MFKLSFAPRFARQQRTLFTFTEAPAIELGATIESSLLEVRNASEESDFTTPRTEAELWKFCLRAGKTIFVKATLASCFASFCATGSTLIAVNFLNPSHSVSSLLLFSVSYFILNGSAQFGNFWTNRLRAELSLACENSLVALISRKILELSTESSNRQSTGNLKVLATADVKNVTEFLNNIVRNLIPSMVSVLIMAPFLLHFSGKAGWVGLAALACIIPVALVLNQLTAYFQKQVQTRMDEHASLVGEWVKNIRLVRYLSWDISFERRLKSIIDRFMKTAIAIHLLACLTFGLSTTWWMVAGTSVLIFAKVYHYPLQMTGFFGSLWLLTFIAGYFTHLPNTIRMLGMAAPSMKRISDLLREKERGQDFIPGSAPAPGRRPVKVVFDQVCFRYPDTNGALKSALSDVNLEIRLHQKTAVLGEVGSGKTTFLKLLCGEYVPTEGTIWIECDDGSRFSLWQRESHARFRESLALVPQVPYVSSDALSTNVSFSNDAAQESEVILSLQKAQMQDDLGQFDEGIHQMIGESGVNLSGGQKQRLNLARAFYAKREFLILDDTLSAVDARTEAALMETLCAELGTGILLVTHRLSEIMKLGYVMVFQNGKLIEEGNPEALIKLKDSAFTRALEAYSHE